MSDTSAATSRRRMLAWLGAGGAAALATLFSREEAKAGHDGTNVLHLGESNAASASTTIEATVDDEPAFAVTNATGFRSESGVIKGMHSGPDFGIGVEGVASPGGESGVGVAGRGGHVGVAGDNGGGEAGVKGIGARNGAGPDPASPFPFELRGSGVVGKSFDGIGVYGQSESPTAPALLGESRDAIEREGEGPGSGPGVIGRSGSGTGVRGESLTGFGLEVVGKAGFSTVGSAVVPAGQSSAFVATSAVTADSHVAVTLAGDPGKRQLLWVDRSPGSGFTVHLTKGTPRDPELPLTYSILEPV